MINIYVFLILELNEIPFKCMIESFKFNKKHKY